MSDYFVIWDCGRKVDATVDPFLEARVAELERELARERRTYNFRLEQARGVKEVVLAMRVATLEAALRELVDDIEDRFDMESSSTNPGMRVAVSQARAALAPTAAKDEK